MKILKTSQNRRDFTAILVCNHQQNLDSGYDDAYYHNNVIPKIKCQSCGKQSFEPQAPKYPEDMVV